MNDRSSGTTAELWASGGVSAHREDHKIVEHPAVGPIAADRDVLTDGDAELKIVILTAAPDTEDETRLRLAFLSGVAHPARSPVLGPAAVQHHDHPRPRRPRDPEPGDRVARRERLDAGNRDKDHLAIWRNPYR